MADTVKAVLAKLSAGQISIEEAEQDFSNRDWPVRPSFSADPSEIYQMESTGDVASNPPDSFYEVEYAFAAGQLDKAAYERLSNAALEAQKRL